MELSPSQFYQHAEKLAAEPETTAPVYLLYGEEGFLVNQAVSYLRQTLMPQAAVDFNVSSYFAADADLDRVVQEAATFPIFAERRLIWLREVDELLEKDWDLLKPLLMNPMSTTVFVLSGTKLDKRKRVVKMILDQHLTVEFKKPYENEIPGWIRRLAKDQNRSITDEAIALLHRLVGSKLMDLNSELGKLGNYLGSRSRIEIDDVAQCVSEHRELSVFELTDSFARADKVESLYKLVRLLDQGQSAIGIVVLLARHVRILITIQLGQAQGLSGAKLATYAGVPSYFLKDYLAQAQKWSMPKLEQILVLLADTDSALKSSPLSAEIWLEYLVLKSC